MSSQITHFTLVNDLSIIEDEEDIPIVGKQRPTRINPKQFAEMASKFWPKEQISIELQRACNLTEEETNEILSVIK